MRIVVITLHLILIGLPGWVYGQIYSDIICPGKSSSSYKRDDVKIGKSDRCCSKSAQVKVEATGDVNIVKNVEAVRFDNPPGPHRAGLDIEWVRDKTGTVIFDVYYRRMKSGGLFCSCDFESWRLLYTYKVTRESLSPGGSLSGDLIKTAKDEERGRAFSLAYKPDETYPYDVGHLRWYINNNTEPDGQHSSEYWLSASPRVTEFGDYTIKVEVLNNCSEWKSVDPVTISLKPTCYQDNGNVAGISLTGPELTPHEEGYEVQLDNTYTINTTGITDFDYHYELSHDGEADLSLQNKQLTANAKLGSYRVLASPKEDREECPDIEAMSVFVGGHDLNVEQKCLLTLPENLSNFGFDLEPGEPALEHFAATVSSEKGFIIKPGITLSKGAELILDYEKPQIDEVHELNADMNFIQTTAYDEYGYVLGQSRQYFDDLGRATQSQYKNLTEDVLMTSEVVYDARGRAVLNTLVAPTKTGTFEEIKDECGDMVQTGANVQFEYKSNFITGTDNQPYDHEEFDGAREMSPEPVGDSEPGTLGWYYSANNGSSTDVKMNEPLVASTNYPYSRTIFHHDGTEAVKTTSIPGDAFRIGGGHLGETNKKEVSDDDPYLKDYFTIRSDKLKLNDPVTYNGKFFKTINTDGHGYKAVSYYDLSGNTIISLYFGDQDTPITRSYQFYNARGQLIISLSPKGWEQYSIDEVDFEAIDKTTYSYNVKGQLIATSEIDAGTSEFIYRKDGSIRFSQNAEQRITGRYSYTNYDGVGRPVESGEYMPGPDGIEFGRKNIKMQKILENIGSDGGLSAALGVKRDRVYTFYDLPDKNLPVYREQRFVRGAVSYTKNENVTVWYSYDAQGRIEWLVQEIKGLGIKTADYRYGPTGNVMEVAYQKTDIDEDFYHYYEYDADGRLSKVYTATEPLEYDRFGELTNPEVLNQQALYDYYLHGPLKRIELADRLQGIDFIYTTSGALKGINSGDPERDPGGDNTDDEFRDDVFGMTLDYFANDYSSPGFGSYGHAFSNLEITISEQFTGNIRAQSWFSPVDNGQMRTYAYQYDNRNQLANAVWGKTLKTGSVYNFVPHQMSAFNENIPEYDLNGNIEFLNRNDKMGNVLADFDYYYKGNTNQLSHIKNGDDDLLREYEYNAIGQLLSQTIGKEKQFVQYDVSGKVLGVYGSYENGTYDQPIVKYTYDERGFRLSALHYKGSDKGTVANTRTWYVRDASGQLLSLYSENVLKKTAPKQTEIPLYGSGRLGLYRPNSLMGQYQYELTDHLGNVRAVIGEGTTLTYLATMESERADKEQITKGGYFSNIKNQSIVTWNHTPSVVTIDEESETIADPDEVIRINNGCDECKPNPIGAGIMLPVSPGDVINMEVFVKYANFKKENTSIILPLADYLISVFGLPTGGESWISIFDVVDKPNYARLAVGEDIDEGQPRAFLNYILYDKNLNFEGMRLDQVSAAAEIPDTNPHLHSHEKLFLDVTIQEEGFIYIYVSNDDKQNMDVYFDDLKVTHELSDIVAGADYYPFGLKMNGREITREDFRFGYQGQFAEEDEETGWNSFELRMYDPVVGRWMAKDPYGQFYSPYVGMGNNPALNVDPDGGCTMPDGSPCPSELELDGFEGMFIDLDAYAPSLLPAASMINIFNVPGVPINTSLSTDFQTAQNQAALEAAIVLITVQETFMSQFKAGSASDDQNIAGGTPPIPGGNFFKASPRIFKATEAVSRAKVSKIAKIMKQLGWVGKPIQTYALKDGTQVILNGHHRVKAAAKAGIDVHYQSISLEEAKSIYNWASELEIITSIIH